MHGAVTQKTYAEATAIRLECGGHFHIASVLSRKFCLQLLKPARREPHTIRERNMMNLGVCV